MTMNNPAKRTVSLTESWQLVYLPSYVAVYRKIEALLCADLISLGFQECMLPKMITEEQFVSLERCMPRFIPEWSAESLTVTGEHRDYLQQSLRLCHWQCEPFYLFLQKEIPEEPVRFFDRSGWSYRAEAVIDRNRLLAFQRIEAMFFVLESDAVATIQALLASIQDRLLSMGLVTRLNTKYTEMEETNEDLVLDVEAQDSEGTWIEVAGSHLHGRLMLDGLNVESERIYVTGCCGIGMSRIANLLTQND